MASSLGTVQQSQLRQRLWLQVMYLVRSGSHESPKYGIQGNAPFLKMLCGQTGATRTLLCSSQGHHLQPEHCCPCHFHRLQS